MKYPIGFFVIIINIIVNYVFITYCMHALYSTAVSNYFGKVIFRNLDVVGLIN